MDKAKKGRLLVAGTVAGVLLLVCLLCVIIYQLASMANVKERIADYESQIEYYQSVIDNSESDLEYYKSQAYLDQMARSYHWAYPEDK